jgi:hypothetical protein
VVFPTNTPTDEELEAAFPGYTAVQVMAEAKGAIMTQILALEATQTPRRMRDAILGTDGGWLADLESQIAVLRGS